MPKPRVIAHKKLIDKLLASEVLNEGERRAFEAMKNTPNLLESQKLWVETVNLRLG